MSKQSNKPLYVDVGSSVVAIRCASNHDVLWRRDHVWNGKGAIEEAERICARMNDEYERGMAAKDAEIAKLRREIDLCRGTGAASKARDLIEEMHRIHRLCSETDGDNWKQKIREISCKASWY